MLPWQQLKLTWNKWVLGWEDRGQRSSSDWPRGHVTSSKTVPGSPEKRCHTCHTCRAVYCRVKQDTRLILLLAAAWHTTIQSHSVALVCHVTRKYSATGEGVVLDCWFFIGQLCSAMFVWITVDRGQAEHGTLTFDRYFNLLRENHFKAVPWTCPLQGCIQTRGDNPPSGV